MSSSTSSSTRRFKTPALKMLFKSIDTDKNGTIDNVELTAVLSRSFPNARYTAAEIATIIAEADVNNDGVVSFEEFVNIMLVAEEKANRWDAFNSYPFTVTMRNLSELRQLVTQPLHEASKPVRELAKHHSYSNKTGTMVCSVPFRFLSEIVYLAMILICFRLLVAKEGQQLAGISSPLQVVVSLDGPNELLFAKVVVVLLLLFFLSFYMIGTTPGYAMYASLVHENTNIKSGFFLSLLFDATTFLYFVVTLCFLMGYPDCVSNKTVVYWLDISLLILKASEFFTLLSTSKSFVEHLFGLEISTSSSICA